VAMENGAGTPMALEERVVCCVYVVFTRLTYAPYVVTDNTMMVEYFIRGLRAELQDAVIPLMCKTMEEAAQQAAILERTEEEVEVEASSREVFSRVVAIGHQFQRSPNKVRVMTEGLISNNLSSSQQSEAEVHPTLEECGTVEVCVVFLDTLTLVLELYVWLRERRQVLRPETLEVPGMGLQLCVCRCGVGWSPQLFDFFLVEQQLDLSSVTARLRVELCSVEAVSQSRCLVCSFRRSEVWSIKDQLFVSSPVTQMIEVVRLRGSVVWAWSTHWFTVCERDSEGHRVLNVMDHDIAIMKLLFESSSACMPRVACGAGQADLRNGKATAFCVAIRKVLLWNCQVIRAVGVLLGVFSPQGHYV
ncbi:hypothetical protein Taro_048048, partial [Colocasia esculenta]|nr:hypothetical protein [Colocasia esculenta]